MIRDQGIFFLDGVAIASLPTNSTVLENGTGGGPINEQWLNLVVIEPVPVTGTITAELQSSDTSTFTASTTHATYVSRDGVINTKLPPGIGKYLRLKLTKTYTAGKVTSSLVSDVDIPLVSFQ